MNQPSGTNNELHNARNPSRHAVPSWNAERRELSLGDVVCKQYRRPAKNQVTILAAFEEDGWPARIDNPLSGNKNQARDRLHEVVKKLNRQTNPLIRFRSDGTGQGIIWEPRKPIAPRSA